MIIHILLFLLLLISGLLVVIHQIRKTEYGYIKSMLLGIQMSILGVVFLLNDNINIFRVSDLLLTMGTIVTIMGFIEKPNKK
jgi:hypothetical protein